MPAPSFHNYPGSERQLTNYGYNQAVVLGPVIKLSGQGGWDPSTFALADTAAEQVRLAFDNIERALKAANPQAEWRNVYQVRSYHVDIKETLDEVAAGLKRLFGEGKGPVWTAVGTNGLGIEEMRIEIEVEAWVGD